MGLRHDLIARVAQRSRPRYGDTLVLAGADLPEPERLTVRTRHGDVRCLRHPGTAGASVVHLHGGAFVTRYPQMDGFWARFVVATTGLTVVLPDYDVAPQARYPVAHEQTFDVVAALAGAGPVAVSGFSAGGNLAAATALWARDEDVALRGQLLGVPSLDVAESAEDKLARRAGMVDRRLLTLVRETYFRDRSRRAEPTASPLRAVSLAGVAPAFVVTAERDTLGPEGDAYAARLVADGVPTEHVVAPGVDHYFLHGAGVPAARALMTRMSDWLAAVSR